MSDAKPRGGAESLFIVDANNLVFRAYHGLPPLTSPDGTPVNAVHGYVRMILALRREFAPESFVAVFDAKGPSFRREIYEAYKANRPPAPEDLIPQLPLVREATAALSIPWTEEVGFEADDLVASYAIAGRDAGHHVTIVSSDKDLMQLVDPEDHPNPIRMWDPMKSRLIGPAAVVKKFGVGPEKLGDLLALTGDSVDNVPGVPGIGPKTAATLLEEYGDLEAILQNAPEIKQKKRRERLIEHADDARMSRELVELRRDAPRALSFDELRDPGSDPETMRAFFEPLGFKSVLAGSPNLPTSGGKGRRAAVPKSDAALAPMDAAQIDALDALEVQTFAADNLDALRDFVDQAGARGGLGLAWVTSEEDIMRAELVGVGLSRPGPKGEGVEAGYLPLAHRSLADGAVSMIDREAAFEILAPALAEAGLFKYVHGYKELASWLEGHGHTLAGVRVDPMLASYTLDPARSSHELDALAKGLADFSVISLESVVGKGRKRVPIDQVAVAQAAPWAGQQAALSLLLGQHLEAQLEAASDSVQKLFYEVEMPLAEVLMKVERRGILLDAEVFHTQAEEIGGRLERLRKAIEADAGYPINPESPQQLQKLLFEDRGLPAKKKTKTGYSTDASVLEELSLLDPIVKLILEHRSLNKLKGTYLDTLPTLVAAETGRLHSHFRQAVAQTGRLSSRDPNLQNIPIRTDLGRRIREGFVAPQGQVLVTLDYSQIELRVLAHLSGDEALTTAFREGADVHRRTAAEIFEVPFEEVDSEQRTVAKAVNFGVIYGQSAFGLSRTLGIPQGRAGRYIKRYFERIPGVAAYMETLIDNARRTGYAETISGRRRRIPELSRRGAAKAYGERIARNTPIQGSAADIMKIAMVEVERRLAEIEWARMLLTVHDELIFECEEAKVDALIELAKPAMEEAFELSVPLVVDRGVGRSWAEAKG